MSWTKWNEEHHGQSGSGGAKLPGSHPTLHPDNLSKSGAQHTHVSGPMPTVGGPSLSLDEYHDQTKAHLGMKPSQKMSGSEASVHAEARRQGKSPAEAAEAVKAARAEALKTHNMMSKVGNRHLSGRNFQ